MSQVMKTSDKKTEYFKDIKQGKLDGWLLKALLWTSLTNQSHMRSFFGSDSRLYRNELCLDITNGSTLASEKLKKLQCNNAEKTILSQWDMIVNFSKNTSNYDSKLTYGVFQIDKELNTTKDVQDKRGKSKKVYDYPELNGHVNTLKALLK